MKKNLCAVLAVVLVFTAFACPTGAVTLSESDTAAVDGLVCEANIPELHAMLVSGLISSRRLTEICIERINEYNGTYNCFITLCDNALSEADARDEKLADGGSFEYLFGIPVVISDDIDLSGEVTTRGYSRKQTAAKTDADVVTYLKNSGAVIVGKTNVSTNSRALNYTISAVSGETKNAYSKSLSSGGSSGGSAASVSLNMAVAGLGADSGGGLLYPAALNGCFALRATDGTVSDDGVYFSDSSRGTVGGVARSVSDLAIITDCISGGKTSYFENLSSDSLVGVKIGVLTELSSTTSLSPWPTNYVNSEVVGIFKTAVSTLEKYGAEVVEISIPNLFLFYFNCSKDGDAGTVAKEQYYSAFRSAMESASVDAVVFPTYLSAPNSSGRNAEGYPNADYESYVNTSAYLSAPLGLPELTLPIGKHSSGASVGMEIATVRGGEQKLFNIAYSIESRLSLRDESAAENLYATPDTDVVKLMFKYRTGPFEFLNSVYESLGL